MANTGATTFLAVFCAVSAGLLGWIGLAMNPQKDITAENATDSGSTNGLAENRQRLAGLRDVELKVYDAVVGVLQKGWERRQIITRSLVKAMMVDGAAAGPPRGAAAAGSAGGAGSGCPGLGIRPEHPGIKSTAASTPGTRYPALISSGVSPPLVQPGKSQMQPGPPLVDFRVLSHAALGISASSGHATGPVLPGSVHTIDLRITTKLFMASDN